MGKNIKLLRGEGNIKAVGKGKQYHLLYDIKAVGKNIKLGRVEGNIKAVGKRKQYHLYDKKAVGKNIKLGRGEGNIKAVGKGKQYHLYDIKVVGNNIKWGRGAGAGETENLRMIIKMLKKIWRARISSCMELYTPLKYYGISN